MDLTHLKYDLSLHKQLEELYLSTKQTIDCMDEMRNKESNTLSLKQRPDSGTLFESRWR